MVSPISFPSLPALLPDLQMVFSDWFASVIIIILKNPCTIVCEISRIFTLFSARYVQTFCDDTYGVFSYYGYNGTFHFIFLSV